MHDDLILRSTASPVPWKQALSAAIRDPDVLIEILGLPEHTRAGARRAAGLFGLVVPRGFLARMTPGDPGDPLLRQVLPLDLETAEVEGFQRDPVGDEAAKRAPGLLHKYHGRALLITAGTCAVNCRYCFRRHYPYPDDAPRGLEAWEPALETIAGDSSLHEIILSGGDPLILADHTLSSLVDRLEAIPHLRRLRVHSRLPVVIPERVDDSLIGWLTGSRLTSHFVVHVNHAREIDASCAGAFARLIEAGVPVLNQSVLLRGVNDDAATQIELCERLIDCRVQPYYLHQLDPVQGAAHFHVEPERGRQILAEMRKRLPGHAVPRYVREVAGAPHKVDL